MTITFPCVSSRIADRKLVFPDPGCPPSKKAVAVSPDDTAQTLQKRVMEEAEWKLLPQAVSLFCQGKLEIEQDFVKINE